MKHLSVAGNILTAGSIIRYYTDPECFIDWKVLFFDINPIKIFLIVADSSDQQSSPIGLHHSVRYSSLFHDFMDGFCCLVNPKLIKIEI